MKRQTGFTLVEILIVVIILGVLAAVVVPQVSSASMMAKTSTLAQDLRVTRVHLAIYSSQHDDTPPGYPAGGGAADADTFVQQMTMATDILGDIQPLGTPDYDYGPYWKDAPKNPFNGKNSVRLIGDGAAFPNAPAGTDGWVYQPSTLTFRADNVGTDDQGRRYFDY